MVSVISFVFVRLSIVTHIAQYVFDFLARYLRVSLLRTALTIDCTELFSASLLCALKKFVTEVCFHFLV